MGRDWFELVQDCANEGHQCVWRRLYGSSRHINGHFSSESIPPDPHQPDQQPVVGSIAWSTGLSLPRIEALLFRCSIGRYGESFDDLIQSGKEKSKSLVATIVGSQFSTPSIFVGTKRFIRGVNRLQEIMKESMERRRPRTQLYVFGIPFGCRF